MTRFTITDARRAGFCVEGLREFAEKHNLSFYDFVRNGMDEQTLIDLGEEGIVEMINKSREGDN